MAIPSSSPVIKRLIEPLNFLFLLAKSLTAAIKDATDDFMSLAPLPINLPFLIVGLKGLEDQFFKLPGGTTSTCPA